MTTFARSPGGLYYPQRFGFSGAVNFPTLQTQTIGGAATDYLAMAFTVPRSGVIDSWSGLCRGHTFTASHTLRFGLRAYDDVTGSMSATVDEVATASPAVGWYTTGTLLKAGSMRTVVTGQRLCAVVDFTAWTTGGFGVGWLARDVSEAWPHFVYSFGGAAEVKQLGHLLLVLKYSDGTQRVAEGCHPMASLPLIASLTDILEKRQRFTPRFTFECDGADFHIDNNGEAIVCTLYNDAGTVLGSMTLEPRLDRWAMTPFGWPAVTLTAGSFYWLGLKGTSSTAVSLAQYAADATVQAAALWGAGASTATRVPPVGAWSADTADENLWGWLHLAGLPVTVPVPPPTPVPASPATQVGIVAEWVRNEYIISNGSETLGVGYPMTAWRAFGFGCTAFYYEPDADAFTASFGTATYELEREGTLTDNGSSLRLTVETPSVASDAAVALRLQRLYIEADTAGQTVVPSLILDETTVVLAGFSNTVRSTVEYALDHPSRTIGVRLESTTLRDRIDVFGIEVDYYVPEGEPDATFTIPPVQELMEP